MSSLVRVKEEWGGELDELYVGHEVKEEMVLGPDVLQPPDVLYVIKGKEMPAFCADDDGDPVKPCASETLCRNSISQGQETALQAEHRVKQELPCTRDPPMVQIHSPRLFLDLDINSADIKREPSPESKRPLHHKNLDKLQEKYWTQHNIKPCHIPLVRIEEIKKKPQDNRTNNNNSTTDKKKTVGLPKKFFCDYCSKGFSIKQSLQVHIRIHTGEKPFRCKVCNKKFSDQSILIRHRRIHTGEKPHTCDVCQKQFSEKYLLRYHKRVHTGITPYVCKFCSKTYNHVSNWKRHLRTHDKAFTCEICDSHFNLQSKLDAHLLNHLKDKPFSCEFCRKSFALKSHLRG